MLARVNERGTDWQDDSLLRSEWTNQYLFAMICHTLFVDISTLFFCHTQLTATFLCVAKWKNTIRLATASWPINYSKVKKKMRLTENRLTNLLYVNSNFHWNKKKTVYTNYCEGKAKRMKKKYMLEMSLAIQKQRGKRAHTYKIENTKRDNPYGMR